MRSGIRLVNLIIISSLLSGCETAADAFFSAGDRLFQPGESSAASMPTLSVADFVAPYTLNPVKANKDYLGEWVKLRGVVIDIRKVNGISNAYSYLVSLKDENNKTNNVIQFQFGSHNSTNVESLQIAGARQLLVRSTRWAKRLCRCCKILKLYNKNDNRQRVYIF